jgi:hypothetical protein
MQLPENGADKVHCAARAHAHTTAQQAKQRRGLGSGPERDRLLAAARGGLWQLGQQQRPAACMPAPCGHLVADAQCRCIGHWYVGRGPRHCVLLTLRCQVASDRPGPPWHATSAGCFLSRGSMPVPFRLARQHNLKACWRGAALPFCPSEVSLSVACVLGCCCRNSHPGVL